MTQNVGKPLFTSWACFGKVMGDQLWLMKRIREEDWWALYQNPYSCAVCVPFQITAWLSSDRYQGHGRLRGQRPWRYCWRTRMKQWLTSDFSHKFTNLFTTCRSCGRSYITCSLPNIDFLSASLYVSKRGAYSDRLCRDVVGRWLSRACTVAKWCILGL